MVGCIQLVNWTGLDWTGILVFSRYALAVQSRVRYREATDVLSREVRVDPSRALAGHDRSSV